MCPLNRMILVEDMHALTASLIAFSAFLERIIHSNYCYHSLETKFFVITAIREERKKVQECKKGKIKDILSLFFSPFLVCIELNSSSLPFKS